MQLEWRRKKLKIARKIRSGSKLKQTDRNPGLRPGTAFERQAGLVHRCRAEDAGPVTVLSGRMDRPLCYNRETMVEALVTEDHPSTPGYKSSRCPIGGSVLRHRVDQVPGIEQ